jgi:hypothetical protein
MKLQWPREYFDIPVNPDTPRNSITVGFRNGKCEEFPGVSLAMTVCAVDSKYVYIEIVDLLKQLDGISQEHQRRLNHKLSAIRYHLDNFKKEEDDWIKHYTTSIGGGESCNVVKENPKIIFEVEAFLFQIKSCLDVLNQLVRKEYLLPYARTFKDAGEILIQNLMNNYPKDLKEKGERMIHLLEVNREWILHAVAMRDEITHDSDLIGFECFYQSARTSSNLIRVFFPSMPNGTRARTYLENTYQNLLVFISEAGKIICA